MIMRNKVGLHTTYNMWTGNQPQTKLTVPICVDGMKADGVGRGEDCLALDIGHAHKEHDEAGADDRLDAAGFVARAWSGGSFPHC